ncbi:hypothetical protein GQR58_019752 [Nymphon striatum]|nr:hypothetical protein GQR58_019752 [Nymphon striatum]
MPGVTSNANKVKVKKVLKKKKQDADSLKPKFNWIDHCYEETMFSNPNWEKIQEKIGRQLAVKLEERLENYITDEIHQQVLFSLLGKSYVEEYLVAYNYNHKLLESHEMSDSDHNKLVHKMKQVIESDVNKAYTELGYSNLSMNEMREYRNDQNKKKKGLEEKPINLLGKALMKVLHRDPSNIVSMIDRLKNQIVPMPNTLRKCIYIHQLMKKAEEKDNTVRSDVMNLKRQLKEFLLESKGGSDQIQTIRSEEWRKIARDVIDLYHNSKSLRGIDTDEHLMTTSRILNLLEKANDNYRQSLIYWLCPFLLAFESHSSLLRDDALIEVTALFDLVDRFLIPTHAQIFSITHKVVDEIVEIDKEFYNHLINCLKINPVFKSQVLQVQVLQGSVLSPILFSVYMDDLFKRLERSGVGCSMGNYFVGCLTCADDLTLIAPSKKALQILINICEEYASEYDDFTLEVLHIEHEKADKLLKDLHSDPLSAKSVKIITNPQTYMRRWVADGFLNSLRLEGALFLWDQMFYSRWEPEIVQKVLLVIMMLLKPWFLRAENYSEIRRVFMEEPARLYTSDIRRALRQVFNNKPASEISSMNRNILQHSETPPPPPAVYHPPPESPIPIPIPVPVHLPSESEESSSESESELEAIKLSESESEEEIETDQEPEPEPEPEPDPELDEREDIFSAWLPFNKQIKKKSSSSSRINAPFDLYVDAVRFLPDNATIAKVTGKILNSEDTKKNDDPDIIAYADLNSPAKRPEFKFKLPVHGEQVLLNPNVVLLLRVYTVEAGSNELVILGSCLFNIFRNKPSKPVQLRVGGHQVRLRRGFPKNNTGNLSAKDMDENLPIPCATILFRLLPHTEKFQEMPDYCTHYYQSKHSLPTYSECNIYEDFMQRPDKNDTVTDTMKNKFKQSNKDPKKLENVMRQLLERRKKSNPRQINLNRLINYNKEYGIAMLAEEAHRLPVHMSGKIFHTVLQILPGKHTFKETKTFTVVTEKLELESSHLDPNWMDSPSKVKSEYDENSVLFVQIFGLNVDYQFPDGNKPGKIKSKNDDKLILDLDQPLAWTVIPMFKNGVVNCGTFLAPLIKHNPNKKIIQSLQNKTVEKTFKTLTDEIKFCESSSIEITLWDGHFITTECPPLTKTNHLIKLTPKPDKYMKAIQARNQTSFVDLLINQKIQKEGPEAWLLGSDSTKVQEDFVKNYNIEFMKLLSSALAKKKLDPVTKGGVDDIDDDSESESEYDSDG